MIDVTQVLAAVDAGDPQAAEQLFPLVYDELRKLAAVQLIHEKPGQTLQPTALVHEAYLRLIGPGNKQGFSNRRHFFAAAAEAMRRILVDQVRRKHAVKRSGKQNYLELDELPERVSVADDTILALDAALEKLAQSHPEKAQLVKLRYFVGMTGDQAAEVMGISASTADRYWVFARAWLQREIEGLASKSLTDIEKNNNS